MDGQSKNFFTSGDGNAWAGVVADVNDYITTSPHNWGYQIVAVGAADIENLPSTSSPLKAADWAAAYSDPITYPYYDYGAAVGCPYGNAYGDSECNQSWYTLDFYYLSWGAPAAYPAPEDYNETYSCAAQGCSWGNVDRNSRQWEAISRYGYHYNSGPITVRTVTTQHHACAQRGGCSGTNNTSGEGTKDMFNALNHDYAPNETDSSITYATDFEWGYDLP